MNNPNNQRHEGKKQEEATRTGLKQVKVAIDSLTNEVKAYRAETKGGTGQKWIQRTAKAAIGYTILTAIIMGVSVYQTYLVRSNNVVSQRAFISFGFRAGPTSYSATPKHFTVGSVLDAATNAATGIAVVSFITDVSNSGNTATKNLTFFLKCAASNERLQDPWSILYQGVSNPIKSPQFIGPHANAQVTCGYSGEQIAAISKGVNFGYIMIDATYQDRLVDAWHKTQATVTIAQVQYVPTVEPSGTIGQGVNIILATYGKHNCADEECPPN